MPSATAYVKLIAPTCRRLAKTAASAPPMPWRRCPMNPAFDFSGQTVIVTGAARGIGQAAGKTFIDAGAAVWLVDADADALAPAAAAGGIPAFADVSSTSDV